MHISSRESPNVYGTGILLGTFLSLYYRNKSAETGIFPYLVAR